MARKTSARVILNRQKVNEVRLAVADGLLAFGQSIVDVADVPDAAPFGVGLVTHGGAVVYIDGRKVGGDATKPSRERVPRPGISGFVGFDFPARFQEIGTVHQDAQPFLWPAAMRQAPHAGEIMKPAAAARLGRR